MAAVSATDPDWSREAVRRFWDPSRQLLRCVRRYQGIGRDGRRGRRPGPVRRRLIVAQHRFWSIVSHAEIKLCTELDGELVLPHPVGVVINSKARIGPNCMLFQNVTLGTNRRPGAPRLGGHVDVGPGAQILGPVTIGDHAVIGANAVVLSDVPAGAVVGGVPARILRRAVVPPDGPAQPGGTA